MQCGRPGAGARIDDRALCAHCFMQVVEIVAHELRDIMRPQVCGFPSSVSPANCILPPDHSADSATRFHRFARLP